MKIANIVTVHKSPHQLARMINAFSHPSVFHFIHLDAKVDIKQFLFVAEFPRVKFIQNRCKVNWAGFGQVQSTLNSFREILQTGIDFDYFNLITGQDYPIKRIDDFVSYLAANEGKEFFQFQHAETEWLESVHRFKKYHFTWLNIKGRYRLEYLINALLPPRKAYKGYEIYGRSAYFTITSACVKFIVAFVNENPDYVKYFKTVWAPDEMFFQTLLLNSLWKNKLINNNLRYIEWYPKVANPKIFTQEDLPKLKESPHFIARKFDEKVNSQILDLLDVLLIKT